MVNWCRYRYMLPNTLFANFISILCVLLSAAQNIAAQPNVCWNSTQVITGGTGPSCSGGISYRWDISGATIISQDPVNVHQITVRWTGSGICYVRRLFTAQCSWGPVSGTLNDYTYNVVKGPPTPPAPIIVAGSCGVTVTLKFNGTPANGESWYWQTSATGESTADNSVTKTVNTGQIYYLRAKDNCGWSGGVSVSTITPPPAVSQDLVCYNFGDDFYTFRSSSSTDRWYDVSSGGSPLHIGNTFKVSKTDTRTFYVEAVSSHGCVSSRTSIVGFARMCSEVCDNVQMTYTDNTSYPFPITNSAYTVINGSGSQGVNQQTLVVNWTGPGPGSAVREITYYSNGQYHNTSKEMANVFIKAVAPEPPTPTVAYECNAALLSFSDAPAAGVTWYWQESPQGISEDQPFAQLRIFKPKTVYLRAKNMCGWSAAVTVTATPTHWVSCPIVPTLTRINATQSGFDGDPGINILDVNSTDVAVLYHDGLGRPKQNVDVQHSPSFKDLVQPIVYDTSGREKRRYLPFTAEANGSYKPHEQILDGHGNYAGIAQPFYAVGSNNSIADDTLPYGDIHYEPSPLNRPIRHYGPGSDWRAAAKNRFIEYQYIINQHGTTPNTAQEKIIAWKLNSIGNPVRESLLQGCVEPGGYYSSGQLTVNIVIDEHKRNTREYVNKRGMVVLRKVQVSEGTPDLLNRDHWALTYYLYDAYDQLRFVLQPELSRIIHQNDAYSPSSTDLSNYAFQYRYDQRKRLVEVKIPGAEWCYRVYDDRDRLVMTQDAKQRLIKQWLFTKYDAFNRVVTTGILTTPASRSRLEMQQDVNTFYSSLGTTGGWFERFVGNIPGNVHGYDNKSFPSAADPASYLTVNYYDNYIFRDLFYSDVFRYKASELTAEDAMLAQESQENVKVKGQLTGTKTRMLTSASWLKTVNYYDDNYRIIQHIGENVKGVDITTNVYDFSGKILRTKSSLYTGQPLVWTNIINAQVSGEVMKGTNAASWAGGASSQQILPTGSDGWIEFTVEQGTPNFAVGLNDLDAGQSYNNIDYCILVFGGALRIYENNTLIGTFGAVQSGDVLRIERVDGVVYYKRNGLIVKQSAATTTIPSTTSLVGDVSFHVSGAYFSKARLSHTFLPFSATPLYFTKQFTYDHAGRLAKTYHQVSGGVKTLLSENKYNELGQLVDKGLHSTDGIAFKQSVDYRYNIRGWLTSINNAELVQNALNDDTGDLFGMDLAYNENLGTGNTSADPLTDLRQYNGNISAIKWSNYQGRGTIKTMAYNFRYDPLNRLNHASHVQSSNNTNWTTGQYHENNILYDLNGNIQKLKRFGENGVLIDDLTYGYASFGVASNKLLQVTDGTVDPIAKVKGFLDGAAVGDYDYDLNGNLTIDKNRGITSPIVYNHLNLPERIAKGSGIASNFLFDALGRKHAQVVQFEDSWNSTEYAGSWIFENNTPQFLQHEEGRVMLASEQIVFNMDADGIGYLTPSSNVTLTQETIHGQKCIKMLPATGTIVNRIGIASVGGSFLVSAGQRYKYRVKGHVNAKAVYLSVMSGASTILWQGAKVPGAAINEMWVESSFTIPAGITQITIGLWYATNAAATAADYAYISEIALYRLDDSTPEYQYYLKDHLGNIRTTFTSKEETNIDTATLETEYEASERGKFLYYDEAIKVYTHLFDHTNQVDVQPPGGPHGSPPIPEFDGYSTRLTGAANAKFGLAKSLSVMPGDVITIEVYAKYLDTNAANWTMALRNLMMSMANGTAPPGTIIDGGVAGSIGTATFPFETVFDRSSDDGDGPKAYLNYLFFDRNYTFITGGCKRLSAVPRENGTNVPHERLAFDGSEKIVISEPGYVYIYLSNENETPVEVYFDDLKVTHVKSPVIQVEDYYPFGLSFNSYQRESTVVQRYQFNGMEKQNALNLNVYSTFYRYFDPTIGRWWGIDPKPNEMLSPYVAMGNNPVLYSDPMGDTTKVYSKTGVLLRTIDDTHSNQVHFVDEEKFNKMSQGDKEDNNRFANRVRKSSVAFIGSNTINDMEGIVNFSNDLNKEVAFVGEVSRTRELRLTKLPTDENNYFNVVNIGVQIDKHFSSTTQDILFFAGHVHHRRLSNKSDKDAAKQLAIPTIGLQDNRPYDYFHKLRAADGTLRPSPGVIATPFGMTIHPTIPNEVYSYPNVELNSTVNYKFFKQGSIK